jgi:hypothetical protein
VHENISFYTPPIPGKLQDKTVQSQTRERDTAVSHKSHGVTVKIVHDTMPVSHIAINDVSQ